MHEFDEYEESWVYGDSSREEVEMRLKAGIRAGQWYAPGVDGRVVLARVRELIEMFEIENLRWRFNGPHRWEVIQGDTTRAWRFAPRGTGLENLHDSWVREVQWRLLQKGDELHQGDK